MPPQLTGGNMAEAKDYKERLSKIIQESIDANQAQILQGAPTGIYSKPSGLKRINFLP